MQKQKNNSMCESRLIYLERSEYSGAQDGTKKEKFDANNLEQVRATQKAMQNFAEKNSIRLRDMSQEKTYGEASRSNGIIIQYFLQSRHCDIGPSGLDGKVGADTMRAMEQYEAKRQVQKETHEKIAQLDKGPVGKTKGPTGGPKSLPKPRSMPDLKPAPDREQSKDAIAALKKLHKARSTAPKNTPKANIDSAAAPTTKEQAKAPAVSPITVEDARPKYDVEKPKIAQSKIPPEVLEADMGYPRSVAMARYVLAKYPEAVTDRDLSAIQAKRGANGKIEKGSVKISADKFTVQDRRYAEGLKPQMRFNGMPDSGAVFTLEQGGEGLPKSMTMSQFEDYLSEVANMNKMAPTEFKSYMAKIESQRSNG